jgi:ISXO2-like transposase domain/Transposase zinc-ribbon domain
MARNKVQFQKGLGMAEFQQLYGTEELCHAALVKLRWPDGFACPKCAGTKHSFCAPKRLFQCSACRKQTSVRAGTVFEKSKTPLTKWFLVMHLMTCSKNDIASLELARQIDVKWDTAWLIKQKLMEVMLQRNSIYRLSGDIQIDDAYQGGEKAGKPGRRVEDAPAARGAANKLPFIIAVETRDGRPIYTQLRCIPGFTSAAIKEYALANIEQGSRVLSDGLACFNGIAEAGLTHQVTITGGGRPKDPEFKWVNTGLGNVKGSITGTLRSLDARHAPRYLAAFEWRYNRRFDLPRNLERLACVAVTIAPKPHKSIAAIRPKAADLSG